MRPRIAVLASGAGSTAEAFIRASASGQITSQIDLVISSREDSGIIERIKLLNQELGLNVDCLVINAKTHPAKANEKILKGRQTLQEELAILDKLKSGGYDLIALMGYMKKIGKSLTREFGWRPSYTSIYQAMMVNTHPGILPDTKAMYGQQIQEYILKNNLPYAGQTLHLVSENYDEGPIIAEHRVEVKAKDDAIKLFNRVQQAEKKYLPKDIEAFVKARLAYRAR